MPRLSAFLLPALLLLGCASSRTDADILNDPDTRVTRSGWHMFEKMDDRVAGKSVRRQQSGPRDLRASYGWGLSIAIFDGIDRLDRARRLVRDHRVNKALFAEKDGTVEVFVGHYDKADDADAQKEVLRWQRVEGNAGEEFHPFANAAIQPLPSARKPADDDPLNADQFHGYATYLVAFYTEDFGKNWREEAKRVAKILRQQGPDGKGPVEAYYRISEDEKESAVLVGLFTRHDHWVKKQAEGQTFFTEGPGPAVEEVAVRFPHLLRNNKKIPAAGAADGAGQFQKPQLVELLE